MTQSRQCGGFPAHDTAGSATGAADFSSTEVAESARGHDMKNRKLSSAQPLSRPLSRQLLRLPYTKILLLVLLTLSLHGTVQAQMADKGQVEGYSETVPRRARRTVTANPEESLRTARVIYVRSISVFVTAEDIENKLRRNQQFQRLGMVITRQEADADLILEVRRSVLTKFVFTAIEPRSLIVVASGKLSSLGGTVDGKVAKLFMKQLMAARR